MKMLSEIEILQISGGKPRISNFIFSGVVGAVVGMFVCGPPCALAGAYTAAASAGIKEAGMGLAEIHQEVWNQ
jgi:hypothetical protein